MIHELKLRIDPITASNEQDIIRFIAQEKSWDIHTISAIRILRRSIDARQRNIFINLTVTVYLGEEPEEKDIPPIDYPDVSKRPVVIVVGAGPAGLFAALTLIRQNIRPLVIERGKDVSTRQADIARLERDAQLNPESNCCFGEGGAGAFSDGKLFTRSHKRGDVNDILYTLCRHGASKSILYDAHPHIGTDRLPRIIQNIRQTIINAGGMVYFGTRMEALLTKGNNVIGIRTANGQTFLGPIILATGHSARDVYKDLNKSKIEIQPKGIAMGVRIEHPATLIDAIQYHNPKGRGAYLPAAEYSFTRQVDERGVYSFCMCPGGFVIPASTSCKQIVVNGMSPANRGSKWSNAGVVVEIRPEDLTNSSLNSFLPVDISPNDPLAIMQLQEALENLSYKQSDSGLKAPAQRMTDFLNANLSNSLPSTSYRPGLITSPLHLWLPNFIVRRLSTTLKSVGVAHRGYVTSEATMIAIETRTSAPIRILRDPNTLSHIRLQGLFPCGEGAGYAGGIVSAAIDGQRCAKAAADYITAIH